ncbi:MAG: Rrf2 family transcriptional regulator [Synergistaceae bacterium]|nr:Rrf2 family transcriptional regulator [Synergistaceae bacterium]
MQISSRFTIAIHILTCIDYFSGQFAITSDFLASSIQVNPVIIRRLLLQLKAAGMINIKRGKTGMNLAKSLGEITLYDIYKAVDCVEGDLFHFHENPNPKCPVGKNIHFALDDSLHEIQFAMEEKLRSFTVRDIAKKIK